MAESPKIELGVRIISAIFALPFIWLALFIIFAVSHDSCDALYQLHGVIGKGCERQITENYERYIANPPASPALKTGWTLAVLYVGFIGYSIIKYVKESPHKTH